MWRIQLSAAAIVGDRITVPGISGSGKSNTAAVIVEEIIEYIPVTIEEQLEQSLHRDGETDDAAVSVWKSNSVDRQQRALNRLIRRLQKIRRRNAFHIDLLFLLDETDQTLTPNEIAEMLGLKYSTVSGSPPIELIEEGLLERQGRPYEYRCIAKVFPDIPGTDIWERLQSELYGEAV